jgi:hypothetical protein
MCGPIVGGLIGHAESRGAPPEGALGRRARGALAYQGGRAVTYALLGALAGGLGASIEGAVSSVTSLVVGIIGVITLGVAAAKITGRAPGTGGAGARAGRALGGVLRKVARLAPRRGPVRMAVIGALMGFLPCMLMFWALGLAVASADWLHGAAMMVTLVGMTTPVILAASCSTALLGRKAKKWGDRLAPWALGLSGLWMLAITAAANGWIPHAHFPVRLGGQTFTIMFF